MCFTTLYNCFLSAFLLELIMRVNLVKCLYFISLSLFLISLSITVPIYCRTFYFIQIDYSELESNYGYDKNTVINAYNDILDFLTLHKEFDSGQLKVSQEGIEHFKDCQVLFDINLIVFTLSLVILLFISVYSKINNFKLTSKNGLHYNFFVGVFLLSFLILFVAFCMYDFNSVFILFHKIFFPGKSNWLFSPIDDEIINIFPLSYFANCAILVASIVAVCSIILILHSLILYNRNKKNKF